MSEEEVGLKDLNNSDLCSFFLIFVIWTCLSNLGNSGGSSSKFFRCIIENSVHMQFNLLKKKKKKTSWGRFW